MSESWEELVARADRASEQNQFEEAITILKQALELAEGFGERDNRLVVSLQKLAEANHRTDGDDLAEEQLKRAIQLNVAQYGPHSKVVADCSNQLASLYYEKGRFPEAETICRKIVLVYEKAFGAKHMEVGKVAQNLAMILQEQNKIEEAEKFYQKSLAIMRESAGPFDSDIISLMENYANLLRSAGRSDEADHLQACAMGRVSGSLRSVTHTRLPRIEI